MLEELPSAEEAKRLSKQENIKKDEIIEEGAWNEAVNLIKKAVSEGKTNAYTHNFPMTSALKKKLEELGYKVSVGPTYWMRANSEIIW